MRALLAALPTSGLALSRVDDAARIGRAWSCSSNSCIAQRHATRGAPVPQVNAPARTRAWKPWAAEVVHRCLRPMQGYRSGRGAMRGHVPRCAAESANVRAAVSRVSPCGPVVGASSPAASSLLGDRYQSAMQRSRCSPRQRVAAAMVRRVRRAFRCRRRRVGLAEQAGNGRRLLDGIVGSETRRLAVRHASLPRLAASLALRRGLR